MFCVSCGKSYDPRHKFCNHCGQPLDDLKSAEPGTTEGVSLAERIEASVVATATDAESQHTPETAPALLSVIGETSRTVTRHAQFRQLVLHYIGLLVSSGAFVLAMAERYASGNSNQESSLLTGLGDVLYIGSISGCVVFLFLTARSWKRTSFDPRARTIAITGVAYLIVMGSLSYLFGDAVGQNRRSILSVRSDIATVNEVGSRIGKARSVELNTIGSFVSAYRKIEPDIEAYETANQKLLADLEEYKTRFPDQQKWTTDNLASTRVELRRSTLLKKQIEVLKQIEQLDPALQTQMWQSSMRPLIQEENKLN